MERIVNGRTKIMRNHKFTATVVIAASLLMTRSAEAGTIVSTSTSRNAVTTYSTGATGAATQALASGAWVYLGNGWYWLNPDGSMAKNTWAWLDGNRDNIVESYCFGTDGRMLADMVTPDGYTVDINGAWTINGIPQRKTVVSSGIFVKPVHNVSTVSRSSSEKADDYDEDLENEDIEDEEYSSQDLESSGSSYAEEVIRLVNIERRKAGKSALSEDPDLMEIAQQRAEELLEKYDHERPDGSRCFSLWYDYGFEYGAKGENIAYGQGTPEQVMNAWMHSEGHRKNILSGKYDSIGVGVVPISKDGKTLAWAQAFNGD